MSIVFIVEGLLYSFQEDFRHWPNVIFSRMPWKQFTNRHLRQQIIRLFFRLKTIARKSTYFAVVMIFSNVFVMRSCNQSDWIMGNLRHICHIFLTFQRKQVQKSIQKFLAFKRTALLKRIGALILIGCFRNTTRTLFQKKGWKLAYFKSFYMYNGIHDFIFTYFALYRKRNSRLVLKL